MNVRCKEPLIKDTEVWLVPGVIRGPQMVSTVPTYNNELGVVTWTVHGDFKDALNKEKDI